jgi:ribosomal-protein-serine acetyltransferase
MPFPAHIAPDIELDYLDYPHLRRLFAVIDRDRDHLRQWQNWPDALKTIDDVRGLIARSQYRLTSHDGFDLVIVYQGDLAGKVGLSYIDWADRKTEIGYWVSTLYEGRGLITRSCAALLDHVFFELKLDTAQIRCAEGNTRSRAIPQRLGFRCIGTLPFKTWLHGQPTQEVMYVMDTLTWKRRTS